MANKEFTYERYSTKDILNISYILTRNYKENRLTSMPLKIVSNPTLTKILTFRYVKPKNKNLNSLLSLLTKINNIYKKHIQRWENSTPKERILFTPTTALLADLEPLLTEFTIHILSICEYRTIWNAQFPEKQKPIKYTKRKETIVNNIGQDTPNFTIIDLEYAYTFYDIMRRIEKITGMKFSIHPNYGILYPIYYFTKVITLTSNKLPIISYYPNETVITNCTFKDNKWWDNTLLHDIYDQTIHNKTKELIFKTKKYKVCPQDSTKWTQNSKFQFISTLDAIGCPICAEKEAKYVPPKFDQSNIYHDHYHSTRSGFKFQVKKLGHEPSIPIGIELETELALEKVPNYDRNSILYTLWTKLGKNDIIFERDGSLNDWGVECITNPMTLEYARAYWKKVKDILPKYTRGINSGIKEQTHANPTNYWGIHLTIKRSYFNNNVALAKFNNFFYNEKNKTALFLIGQRTYLYGGEDPLGQKRTNTFYKNELQFSIDKNRKEPCEKIIYSSRLTAVNLSKKKFVELRFFQSVNTVDEILKNYDFVTALYEWIMSTNTGLVPKATDLFNWILDKNNPQRAIRYKYLVKHLQQPEISVRTESKVELRKNPFYDQFKSIDITKFFKEKTKK